jgi:hypothetical protein
MLSFVHMPELHVSPAQHGWPIAPHWAQTPFAHPSPAPQLSPLQHCWPAAPHAAHVPPAQCAPIAVHWLPGQHAIPRPPQLPQLPFMHAKLLMEHTVPPPTHVRAPPPITGPTQHPPFAQLLRSQHASPGPPHRAHTPRAQTDPFWHVPFGQHG